MLETSANIHVLFTVFSISTSTLLISVPLFTAEVHCSQEPNITHQNLAIYFNTLAFLFLLLEDFVDAPAETTPITTPDAAELEDVVDEGLGRKGTLVVGVVGVPGGVWFGVVAVTGWDTCVGTPALWLWDMADTTGMTLDSMPPPSMSFFTSNARSTICVVLHVTVHWDHKSESHITDKYHYLYNKQCNRGSPCKAQKGLLRAPAS